MKDLLELELEELLRIKEETRQTRKAALEAEVPKRAPDMWWQAEQARHGGETALENKSFQEARLLLEQASRLYEEAKSVAWPSPSPSPSPSESIGGQLEQEPTRGPKLPSPPIVPPPIVHRVQIDLSEIVVQKDGGAGRWSFEILVDGQTVINLPPQTYHDSRDRKRVRFDRIFDVTIQGKHSFIFKVIGRSLDEGYIAEGNVNIRFSSFDEASTLSQTLPVTVPGKNKEGDFDFQLTFVKK